MSSFGDMHHVGITVRDLEASLPWYEQIFGLKPEFIAHGSGPDLSKAVGVLDAARAWPSSASAAATTGRSRAVPSSTSKTPKT